MIIPKYEMIDTTEFKALRSEEANWIFRKSDGYTEMWGKTRDDDMPMSPVPVILDMEVSTICAGPGGVPCSFCYKANGPKGKNMSFETFKNVIDKMNFVTQVAFGADAQGTSNPDLFKMMEYTRKKGIVPNITIADISDETADMLAHYCGAVAVSCYDNENLCYDSVKKLTDRGMKQVNIHFMVCQERLEDLYTTFGDMKTDERLDSLNAIVLLSLKKKGRGKKGFTPLTQEQFKEVVDMALMLGIPLGFDSCSARKFEKSIVGHPLEEKFKQLIEPCESFGISSSYVDVHGNYFPCSFCPGTHDDWENGISVIDCDDFIKDIWYSNLLDKWRRKSFAANRNCIIYSI